MQLLGQTNARALFQLTFYDLDLTGLTLPPGSVLPLFTHLGLADRRHEREAGAHRLGLRVRASLQTMKNLRRIGC